MKKLARTLAVAIAVSSLVMVSAAFADDEAGKQTCASRHAKMLEQYGDQGIDADGDGTLTHEEVMAFFSQQGTDAPCMHGAKGGVGQGMMGVKEHGEGAPCPHAKKGCQQGGKMGKITMLLEHLEELSAVRPPADLDLETHPGIDSDEDGEVSDQEWADFTEQLRPKLIAHLLAVAPDADADEDGVLSDDELNAFHAEHLALHREMILKHHPQADTDGDGLISDQEAQAVMAGCQGGKHVADCTCPKAGGCQHAKEKGDCPGAKTGGHAHGVTDEDRGHGCNHGKSE